VGKRAWIVSVHSVTRGWQDILFPPQMYGIYRYPYNTCWEACLATRLAGRNIIDSKTYPRKGDPRGVAVRLATDGRGHLGIAQ